MARAANYQRRVGYQRADNSYTVFLRQTGCGASVKPAVNAVELGEEIRRRRGGGATTEGHQESVFLAVLGSKLHGDVRERVLTHDDRYPSCRVWEIGT